MSKFKESVKNILETEDDVEELRRKLKELLDEKTDIPKSSPKPKSGKTSTYRREALNVLCGVFTVYTIKSIEQIFAQNNYDFTATYLYLEKDNDLPKRGRRSKNVAQISDKDLQKECDNLKCSYTKSSFSWNDDFDWNQDFKESPKRDQQKQSQGQQKQSKPNTNNSPMSYYDMLKFMGLTERYNRTDLDRAYRAKARVLHPDKGGTNEQFIELTIIYESLKRKIESIF